MTTKLADIVSDETILPLIQSILADFQTIKCRYECAMREVKTKLEILDQEFEMQNRRNPIHHMESRLKSPKSIVKKLIKKQMAIDCDSAMLNLQDIAGIRVVCAYVKDIYTVANMLISQDDIEVIRIRDYIKEPKPNGYRSLHVIVQIPVFFSQGKMLLPVEVQLRTIAMDFWASLEHHIRYKEDMVAPQTLNDALMGASERIAQLDTEMQDIHDQMMQLAESENK